MEIISCYRGSDSYQALTQLSAKELQGALVEGLGSISQMALGRRLNEEGTWEIYVGILQVLA